MTGVRPAVASGKYEPSFGIRPSLWLTRLAKRKRLWRSLLN